MTEDNKDCIGELVTRYLQGLLDEVGEQTLGESADTLLHVIASCLRTLDDNMPQEQVDELLKHLPTCSQYSIIHLPKGAVH